MLLAASRVQHAACSMGGSERDVKVKVEVPLMLDVRRQQGLSVAQHRPCVVCCAVLLFVAASSQEGCYRGAHTLC